MAAYLSNRKQIRNYLETRHLTLCHRLSLKVLESLLHIWSQHCAISREVAGSIPNGFIGLFIDNLSDRK